MFQVGVSQGPRQRCQQTQIEVWGVGGYGNKANHLYGAAIVPGGKVDGLGRRTQGQPQCANGAAARVGQGDIAAENRAL